MKLALDFLAFFGAIALLAILFFAHRREVQADNAYPAFGSLLEVNGTRVHAVVMGQGPDLVLIHGSSGNVRDFTTSIAPELSKSYRVIMFDRPGLGHSDRMSAKGDTLRDQAHLLRDAALSLGADRPIVLGQSYGGAVALTWALEAPENIAALVTVSGVSHPWPTGLDTYYKITSHPYFGWLGALMISAFASEKAIKQSLKDVFAPQRPPDGYREEFGVELVLRCKTILANARQRRILKPQIINQAPRYSTLSLPIEILHGTADTLVSPDLHARALAKQAPASNLTLLEGIGHMPHHVAKKDVIDAIDRAAERAGLR